MRLSYFGDDFMCDFNVLENIWNVVFEVGRILIRNFIVQHLCTYFSAWVTFSYQPAWNHHTIIKSATVGIFRGKVLFHGH